MKFRYTLTAITASLMLVACGGGGGGGPSYSKPTTTSTTVTGATTLTTPGLVSTVVPLVSASQFGSALNMFTANLTNSGTANVVVAGDCNGCGSANHVNSAISIFGWTNGQFINQPINGLLVLIILL